jgi:hypothetical protein
MATSPTILVLPPATDWDALRRSLTEEGLRQAQGLPGDGRRLAAEEVWASADHRLAANIVDDPLVGCAYLAIRGLSADAVSSRLASRHGLTTAADGLVDADREHDADGQIRANYRVAVLFPDYRPEVLLHLQRSARDDTRPRVREAAVDAMGYRGWAEFIPVLEAVARTDVDEGVRSRAAELLSHLTKRAAGT